MNVGERIRKKRIEKGLTLEEVGSILGIGKAAIHKYENGLITNIPLDKIEKLAEIFECTPVYLTGWENDNNSETSINNVPICKEAIDGLSKLNSLGQKRVAEYIHLLLMDEQYSKNYSGASCHSDYEIAAWGGEGNFITGKRIVEETTGDN